MPTINGKKYKEVRCAQCQKFIVHLNAHAADLYHQCPRCGFINEYTFKFLNIPSILENMVRWYGITKQNLKGGE